MEKNSPSRHAFPSISTTPSTTPPAYTPHRAELFRVIASLGRLPTSGEGLADGTPLVTAEKRGKGWVVLVHTTANAEWSNLSLSGLFVEMLRRIMGMSEGVADAGEGALPPLEIMDGFGRLQRAPAAARPIAGNEITTAAPSPRHPPGFYGTADMRRALNLSTGIGALKPIADLPAGYTAMIAFSPDGKWLVSGTGAEYRFWEVGSWQPGPQIPRENTANAFAKWRRVAP